MRAATTLLSFVLVAALAWRWPIASHDVEHYAGPDEGEVVENVLEMMKRSDLDHRHPGYPGLHFYLQRVSLEAHLALSSVRGEGRSIQEMERSRFYRQARRTTLVAGLLAALATFAAGLRLLSPPGAALAASLVALSPLSFRESAVVNPDLVLSLFVMIAILSALRLFERRTFWSFIAAGASVGLASAIKYTGAFAAIPLLIATALGPEPKPSERSAGKALAGLFAMGAAFALASPYTFWNLPSFIDGLARHVGYYQASSQNGALELLGVVLTRGLLIPAGLAAFAGAVLALVTREPRRLVVLSYPLFYLAVFAFFSRAFPRHAIALLPPLALLAADVAERIASRAPRFPGTPALAGIALAMIAPSLLSTVELSRRIARPSPAERAAEWAASALPEGSRVLQDQYTPRLDPERFRVHRIRVEERVFAGNFDWVFYSGYPPSIETGNLREVARFETEGALGDSIRVFEVPPRESLMGVTLAEGQPSADVGAGELPPFGAGWYPPAPGPYGTERLTRGEAAEIYFVLERAPPGSGLRAEIALAAAVAPVAVGVELNGRAISGFEVSGAEPATVGLDLPPEHLKKGLNRLDLHLASRARLDRRHRDTALRFYRLSFSRS
jgi:4-amino-4-deoxy-L-arabinose transferase-like glycosyltransferase